MAARLLRVRSVEAGSRILPDGRTVCYPAHNCWEHLEMHHEGLAHVHCDLCGALLGYFTCLYSARVCPVDNKQTCAECFRDYIEGAQKAGASCAHCNQQFFHAPVHVAGYLEADCCSEECARKWSLFWEEERVLADLETD